MILSKLTKFEQLVEQVLPEAKTPGKIKRFKDYVGTGPKGLERMGSGAERPISKTDFVRRMEQSTTTGEISKDVGNYMFGEVYSSLIKTFRLVLAQPVQASQLITSIENFNKVYSGLKRTITNIRKPLSNKDKEAAERGLEASKELAAELQEKLDEIGPAVYEEILEVIDSIFRDIVNLLEDDNDLNIPEQYNSAKEYASTIYNPKKIKGYFKAFVNRFDGNLGEIQNNPLIQVSTLFKTAAIKNKEDNVVGDLPALITKMTEKLQRPTGVEASHLGRQKLERKAPQNAKIAKMIKAGRYEKALSIAEGDVKENIQKFIDGEITEADVIRAIYNS